MERLWVQSKESSSWQAQLSHSERGSDSKRMKIKLDYLGNVLRLHFECLENVFAVYLIQTSYTRVKNVRDTRFQNGFETLKCPRSVGGCQIKGFDDREVRVQKKKTVKTDFV